MPGWEQTIDESAHSNLVELIRCRADSQPTRRCFTYLEDGEAETVHLSFGDLDRLGRSLAVKLRQHCAKGDRALLLFPPGLDFVSAFVGCLYADVVAIPAPPPRPNQTAERFSAIMEDAQISVIVTTERLLTGLQDKLRQTVGDQPVRWLTVDGLSDDLAEQWTPERQDRSTLAFLQYTSGSTDRPKGVMVSHGNLLSNSKYLQTAFELSSESVAVTWLPSFHDMGLIDGIIQPLFTGYHAYLMAPTSFLMLPIRWLRAISKYRATHCGGPNFAYDLCVRRTTPKQREGLDLSSWLSAYNGAEPIHADTLRRFAETFEPHGYRPEYMYPCYGLAEATLMVSGGRVSQPPVVLNVDGAAMEQRRVQITRNESADNKELVGTGRSWLDTKIVIVDPQSERPCEAGHVGEVWVSGSSVAQGYWQRSDLTAQVFGARLSDSGEGPFLRTGDLGFLEDGELFIVGRLKDIVIIRGRNYYPQDIERVAEASHEALRKGCNAAFQVEVDAEERLVVAQEVERSHLRSLDARKVGRILRQSVAEQFGLQVYDVMLLKTGSIPKTSSGKIQRALCRQHYLSGELVPFDHSARRNDTATEKVG